MNFLAPIAANVVGGLLGKLFNFRKGGKIRSSTQRNHEIHMGISKKDQVPVHLHMREKILNPRQANQYVKVMKKAKMRYKK